MFRRTLKMAWFKRDRYALTIVAIALSVAFIVSTLLLTTSISNVGEPLNAAYGDVGAVVTGPEVTESDGPRAGASAVVPPSVVTDLEAAGYEAVGFDIPYVQVIDADGNPAGQQQASSNVAEPWLGDSDLNGFELVSGAAPSAPGELVLDVSTADGADYSVGDTITYVTDDGLSSGELVGLATFGGADNDPYVSTVLLDPGDPILAIDEAQAGAGYDYILVAGDGSGAGLVADVAAIAPDQEVTDGAGWVADQEEELNGFLGFFETFLTVFAVIAVVVGMVIVTNTFAVSLAQRTEELALQRLVGTTRRQLMSQVVIEAILLGLAGTFIGTALGLLGNDVLGWFLDLLGLTIERSNTISISALLIGAAVGIGVTVFAAVWPAQKATQVPPIEALRAAEIEPPSAGRRRVTAAILATVIGVVAMVVGVTQGDVIYSGVGVFGLFLALYLGAEFLIRWTGALARPVLGKVGPTGTVASRNLQRNAGRTSAASSALMIGISLISFFTLMAATIGQFVAGDAADELTTDYVAQGIGNFPEPSISADTVMRLQSVDGVDLVVPVSQITAAPADPADGGGFGPGEGALVIGFAEIDDLTQVYEFDVIDGSLDALGGQSVLIDEATATSQNLTVGDSLAVVTGIGPAQVDVAAIVTNGLPGVPGPVVIGSPELAPELGQDGPATVAYINAPNASEGELTAAIGLPNVDVLTSDDFISSLGSNLDTILALVYALLAVAVIIALVGIANTVSLAISERSGEIAAMRAAGASMKQIFWSLIAEFALLAFVGVVSGLALAWVSAAALFQSLSDGQISYPETSFLTGAIIVVVGLAGGALAAWLPSRNASRNDILDVLKAV